MVTVKIQTSRCFVESLSLLSTNKRYNLHTPPYIGYTLYPGSHVLLVTYGLRHQ